MPDPAPVLVTLSSRWGIASKSALTDLAALMVTSQGAVPTQPAPEKPRKVEVGVAVAVRVMWVPWLYSAAQVAPQAMRVNSAAGRLPVTVP